MTLKTATLQAARPSLREIWEIDGRIKAATEEMHEKEREAAAPYVDALELLQAKRAELFEAAYAADAGPEALTVDGIDLGILRIQCPIKKANREICVEAFKNAYPSFVDRCVKETVPITAVKDILTPDEIARVCYPQKLLPAEPKLVLIPPKPPMILKGAPAPRRRKSDIIRERSEP